MPYKTDLQRRTRRPLNRPGRARTESAYSFTSLTDLEPTTLVISSHVWSSSVLFALEPGGRLYLAMGGKVIFMPPACLHGELLMKYTGVHENDFIAQGAGFTSRGHSQTAGARLRPTPGSPVALLRVNKVALVSTRRRRRADKPPRRDTFDKHAVPG